MKRDDDQRRKGYTETGSDRNRAKSPCHDPRRRFARDFCGKTTLSADSWGSKPPRQIDRVLAARTSAVRVQFRNSAMISADSVALETRKRCPSAMVTRRASGMSLARTYRRSPPTAALEPKPTSALAAKCFRPGTDG